MARASLEEPRPTRLPTPRNSISMSLSDPLSPTSTIGSVPHPPRSRSPNATPIPPHHPRLPSTFASRKPSGTNLRNVSNTQTSPIVSSKLSAQPLVPVTKSPKVSRTAQGPDTTRARKVSGVSTSSHQPRSRAQSLVSQSAESVQLRPPSPTKKAHALPQPESPANPSPVKPKPRLGGVANINGSPRPPARTPGSRNTSNVFPQLENSNHTPSPPPPKLPAVVWPVDEEEESINGDWAPSVRPPVSGGTSEAYDFSGIPLGSEGVPHYRAEDEMTMELITEIDDGGELDEDMQASLHAVHLTHVKKLTHYKRLLEGAQTSSASQLHALQAELRMLRAKLEDERRKKRELEMSANKDREALKVAQMRSALQQPQPASMTTSIDLSTLLRGDGQGGFNETEIRRAVRAMRASDRLRLIHIILDSCLPGDISAMIRMLEKYAASTFDIVGNLPEDVAIKILGYLNVMELLDVEVSKKWHMLVRHPAIWRHLCLELTATDPVPMRPPPNPEDWEPLYRSLHHRERNWATGQVQSVRFLKGHTGFCTTLILKGNRLISGSYDETIRIWDIRSGEEKKCLKVKAISCLDYLPDEEVLVAGFHDVGRVQLFSTVTWQPIQTLQGHLYGIRAVALSPKYLVSAGADKALVCWDWRAGQKIVRFGQQTNLNIGVQIVDEDEGRIVGITIDGIVRTFSIPRREMLSQFKLSELGGSDPVLSAKLSSVGVGSANMLQWFAAKGKQMTCATKNLILHLEHEDPDPSVSLSSSVETLPKPQPQPLTPPTTTHARPRHSLAVPPRPESRTMPLHGRKSMGALLSPATTTHRVSSMFTPNRPGTSLGRPGTSMGRPGTSMGGGSPNRGEKKPVKPPVLLSVVDTPDVAVGAVDPKKRRVATSTRFSSRLGADRRIFSSTYNLNLTRPGKPQPEGITEPGTGAGDVSNVDFDTEIATLGGAWAALAEESEHGWPAQFNVPTGFKGLATPEKNPMAMALSHEEVVVGTADGTIYVMSFVGYQYKASREIVLGDLALEEAAEEQEEQEVI
ncbi:unnamed protein product [Rhizoctonia solani]|uniref:F-box domain-containing protein n=1 Tax=Rhizoctonia solani TaxID=456999 RepID=A0A8H2XQZ3_9AGAM|nr:unnamed protein product [Rhizoctonia solani]